MLDKRYLEEKERVREKLQTVDKICITTDTWTSINTDSFIAVTCHFINENFELETYVIETAKFAGSHTACAIANRLDEIFLTWDIQHKVAAVVTDNAANMTAAVKQLFLPTDNIFCFAHTLNLVVKHALDNVTEISVLREKCRRIVTYFKSSSLATDKLNEVQTMLGLPKYKLKSEVATRWNATYEMFDRLLKLKSPIITTLSSLKTNFEKLTECEWDTLPRIIQILQPFFLVTEEISAEKYVSISKIILFKKRLIIFTDMCQDEGVTGILSAELRLQLNKYIHNYETNERYSIPALLDPRFRDLSFDNQILVNEIRKQIINIANPLEVVGHPTVSYEAVRVPEEASSFWATFDTQVLTKNTIACTSGVSAELSNYMKEPYLPRHENPLSYWKTNSVKYPILATLAKEYICIMATSVPSERVFSKTGEIISKKRNRLKDNIVNKILFLNR